jgi:hypothetical protein
LARNSESNTVISLGHFPRELKAAQVTKPLCEAFKFSNASLNCMTRRLDRGLWASCLRADFTLFLKAEKVGIGDVYYCVKYFNKDSRHQK